MNIKLKNSLLGESLYREDVNIILKRHSSVGIRQKYILFRQFCAKQLSENEANYKFSKLNKGKFVQCFSFKFSRPNWQ